MFSHNLLLIFVNLGLLWSNVGMLLSQESSRCPLALLITFFFFPLLLYHILSFVTIIILPSVILNIDFHQSAFVLVIALSLIDSFFFLGHISLFLASLNRNVWALLSEAILFQGRSSLSYAILSGRLLISIAVWFVGHYHLPFLLNISLSLFLCAVFDVNPLYAERF